MIDPKAVIAQHSVEEFCETAEEYYRRVSDPTPLMAKPFASSWIIRDTTCLRMCIPGSRLS